MTTTARKALIDLIHAHEMLEGEEDAKRFRVLWVAAISLARAIGHVLAKIDAVSSPKLRSAISDTYSDWKKNPSKNVIFFEFIDHERNSVLKEFEFGFMSGPINVVVIADSGVHSIAENLFCPLGSGPYAGEDCRDILAEAIKWWELQLTQIERVAAI